MMSVEVVLVSCRYGTSNLRLDDILGILRLSQEVFAIEFSFLVDCLLKCISECVRQLVHSQGRFGTVITIVSVRWVSEFLPCILC